MAKSGPPPAFTERLRALFLEKLAELGNYGAAAAAVGVSYHTTLRYRKAHPEFQEQCDAAQLRLNRELVTAARQHCIEGMVVERVTDKNGNVTEKRKYDTRVLLRWLARRMPEEWGDEKRVKIEGEVQHEHSGAIELTDLSAKQQRLVRQLLLPDEPPLPTGGNGRLN
jgi:hypothetical protein